MKDSLSKSDWLCSQECAMQAWLRLRARTAVPDGAARFRMEQGQEIGALAREIYPDGVLVHGVEGKSAEEVAQDLIADGAAETLCEATFRAGPFVAKVDILRLENGAWHVLEVKSSFSDTKQIQGLIDDLAYTVMVVRKAGLQVIKASLVLLSRDYRQGDPPQRLFEYVDKSEAVDQRVAAFNMDADLIADKLLDEEAPSPKLVSACRECEFFEADCLGSGLAHTVLEIPGLHHTKLKKLADLGVVELSRLPEDLGLNERQQRAKDAALSERVVVETGLGATLEAIKWPCHYLDFETVATVLPLYLGHGCHRQVLTQFSVHHRDSAESGWTNGEYLADPSRDCERDVAEALIDQLGDKGSVIVYSGFEKKRIEALQVSYPDLKEPLQSILDRLVDLLTIIQNNVYHPDFKGSFSIKKVLPALVPELSYEGLDIKDGDTAITQFARMARGQITGAEAEATRRDLLEYCRMDTLAMVRLHETLMRMAVRTRRAGGA